MIKSEIHIKFEEYLDSIGGLENGFYTDRPPIKKRYFFAVDDGWLPLVQELIEKCIELGWNKQICQVKEKFGGLRFYINEAPNEIYDLIDEYEHKSYSICEVCGQKGELRKGGWYRTLCELHDEENIEKNKLKNIN